MSLRRTNIYPNPAKTTTAEPTSGKFTWPLFLMLGCGFAITVASEATFEPLFVVWGALWVAAKGSALMGVLEVSPPP